MIKHFVRNNGVQCFPVCVVLITEVKKNTYYNVGMLINYDYLVIKNNVLVIKNFVLGKENCQWSWNLKSIVQNQLFIKIITLYTPIKLVCKLYQKLLVTCG